MVVRSRVTGGLAATAAVLALGACSSGPTGRIALAVDPAGRLLAVVAVCTGQRLATLTLTDETSGTTTTVRLDQPPSFGGTVILTGPVADPRPEGVFDLLDRSHTYVLAGGLRESESDKDAGTVPAVRFKLDGVVKDTKLRKGSVLIAAENGVARAERPAFLDEVRRSCG